MKILSVTWYSSFVIPVSIGIVKILNKDNEIRYLIGNGLGLDETQDIINIIRHGAQFDPVEILSVNNPYKIEQ